MKRGLAISIVLLIPLALSSCADLRGNPATVAPDLVRRATDTVERFKALPDIADFSANLARARGVVVLPTVFKAGFVGAAEVGSGVLLARASDDTWSYPAFYTLLAGSVGLQIGIQDTEIVLVLLSDKAVEAILTHQGKLGADLGLTVGLVGRGIEASTTANLGVDIIAYANSVIGAFGGASLEGAVLARRNDFNAAYYGAGATPRAITVERTLTNPGADGLRAALANP